MLVSCFLSVALAGGAAEPVRVDQIRAQGDTTVITMSGGERMFADCPTFEVHVRHEWVPWYAWIPSLGTAHPSPAQTDEALAHIAAQHDAGQPVTFGVMGSGIETLSECRYASRGLELHSTGVYSYYRPI